ncbi:MAG: tRNA (guanine(46)-N(7))-methyltransferase TrmB [Filomicrobium sp.]
MTDDKRQQDDDELAKAYEECTDELRSFGRRRGRKLRPRQAQLFTQLLPRVALGLHEPAPQPLEKLFTQSQSTSAHEDKSTDPIREVWLEIGFGGAEHLIWQAENNADVGHIGCEPFEAGVVKALSAIETKPLDNVRLHADDARDLLRWLPEASITRAFILFPDPWPKRRHAKRRLVAPHLLELLARVMAPGAELRIGTDIPDYLRTILIAFQTEPRFCWQVSGPRDWRYRPDDWPPTRYEQKALRESRCCYYLRFRRAEEN